MEEGRIVRGASLATVLVAPAALALSWWAAGGRGLLGAAFGVALAIAFFSVSLLAVGAAGRVSPELMLPAAIGTFAVKMLAIGVLLVLLRDTTAFDHAAFALSLVAATCVYLAAEIRLVLRARIPYVVTDTEDPGHR